MIKALNTAIKAVTKFGPTPIVAVTLGGLALIALAAKADGNSVVLVTLFALIAYIYGQERSARWRKQQLTVDLSEMERERQRVTRKRLERRLKRKREREEPSLFPEQEEERD